MGLFQRMSTVFRSWANSAVDKAESPEATLSEALREMEDALRAAREMVVAEMAEESKLKSQIKTAHEQSEHWARRAIQGVQNDRDDLARGALAKQQQYATELEEKEAALQRQQQIISEARFRLEETRRKLEEARRKKGSLVASHRRNEALRRIHGDASSGEGALDAFERIERKIEDEGFQIEAAVSFRALEGGSNLEQEFQRMEGGDLDEKLHRLKSALSEGRLDRALEVGSSTPRGAIGKGSVESKE